MAAVTFKTQGLWAKAYSRTQWILSSFFEQWKNYGLSIAFPSLVWWIGNYTYKKTIGFWSLKHLTRNMDRYFEKRRRYIEIIEKYRSATQVQLNDTIPLSSYPIWVFWWQGAGAMPTLVKCCFAKLKQHNGLVTLITKENIRNYVNIPEVIYRKVDNGEISYTHLSDILRISLLAEHGGMWVDSTCYVPYAIPDSAKKELFYSPSTCGLADMPMWSNSRWCGWNLGTNEKQNALFAFLRDMLYTININEACLPHYLILDYLLDYAYRKFPYMRQVIVKHKEFNVKRNELHFLLNKVYEEPVYQRLIQNDWCFKLSYKTPWKKEIDGKITFYGKMVNQSGAD